MQRRKSTNFNVVETLRIGFQFSNLFTAILGISSSHTHTDYRKLKIVYNVGKPYCVKDVFADQVRTSGRCLTPDDGSGGWMKFGEKNASKRTLLATTFIPRLADAGIGVVGGTHFVEDGVVGICCC